MAEILQWGRDRSKFEIMFTSNRYQWYIDINNVPRITTVLRVYQMVGGVKDPENQMPLVEMVRNPSDPGQVDSIRGTTWTVNFKADQLQGGTQIIWARAVYTDDDDRPLVVCSDEKDLTEEKTKINAECVFAQEINNFHSLNSIN